MWFGGDKENRKRTPRSRGSGDVRGMLRSNTRLGDPRRGRWPRLQGGVMVLLVVVGLALLGWLLVFELGGALFWRNPRFTVRKVEVRSDGPMIDAQHVREYTGLREGINLFSMRIGRLRRDFLVKTPHARNIVFTRRLPDRIVVAVQERETLARLGRWGHLGVDREGRVFSVRGAARELPVLSGFPAGRLMPGTQVDAAVMRGVEAIEACRRAPAGNTVRLSVIDVAAAEHVELYLVGGERIKLSWDGMGASTAQARAALEHKLELVAKAMQSAQARGKRIATLDMTFGDHYMPSQEY